jgi:hypothetical protein
MLIWEQVARTEPVVDPDEAVKDVVPGDRQVRPPVDETAATAGDADCQIAEEVTFTAVPFAYSKVAVNSLLLISGMGVPAPEIRRVGDVQVTITEALPSRYAASIFVEPFATQVRSPELTIATLASALCHCARAVIFAAAMAEPAAIACN